MNSTSITQGINTNTREGIYLRDWSLISPLEFEIPSSNPWIFCKHFNPKTHKPTMKENQKPRHIQSLPMELELRYSLNFEILSLNHLGWLHKSERITSLSLPLVSFSFTKWRELSLSNPFCFSYYLLNSITKGIKDSF